MPLLAACSNSFIAIPDLISLLITKIMMIEKTVVMMMMNGTSARKHLNSTSYLIKPHSYVHCL